jgi:pimeloyl-ACP methyl ester carboxylesterase
VIDAVGQLSADLNSVTNETMDRKQVGQKLLDAGLDAGIAQWLASSFNGKDFGFDLPVVHDILPEFATQDFYGLLDQVIDNGIRVDLVRGGKNTGWDMTTMRQLEQIQRKHPKHFGMHVLPKAGHWVHVEDLKGLVKLFATH